MSSKLSNYTTLNTTNCKKGFRWDHEMVKKSWRKLGLFFVEQTVCEKLKLKNGKYLKI